MLRLLLAAALVALVAAAPLKVETADDFNAALAACPNMKEMHDKYPAEKVERDAQERMTPEEKMQKMQKMQERPRRIRSSTVLRFEA